MGTVLRDSGHDAFFLEGEPVTDPTVLAQLNPPRFLYATTGSNIDSGEEIRWLPRHAIDPAALTADDWWLFDDDTVAFTAFRPDESLEGFAMTRDRTIAEYCRTVRDRVWGLATPHAAYRITQ